MRNTNQEIELEVEIIRDSGYYGELNIVPVVNKRCFVPCQVGRCNCHATIGDKYCLVTNDCVQWAQKEFLQELKFLETKINKI